MPTRHDVNVAVKEAYDAGLCVVPPREDGTKAPIGAWKDFQRQRPDLGWLRDYYRTERHGLGTLGGSVSGELEVFEVEYPDLYDRFKAAANLAGLEDTVERIEAGYCERAPRGGVHWLWRTDRAGGNTKLAMSGHYDTLIETRGAGGYCILAPSYGPVHPSGNPYVRITGSFATIAVVSLEERQALFRVARTFDDAPKRDEQRIWTPRGDAVGVGERPGDDFDARADWADDVLEPAGWARVGAIPERHQEYWRRPGKDQGHSGVLHTDTGWFVPFSSSTPFPVTEVGYGKFTAYAWLHHGGDFSAAARELRRHGYGQTPERQVQIPRADGVMRGDAIFDLDVPPIESLPILGETGMLMERGSNLIYAYPKCGKTELVTDLLFEWITLGKTIAYLTEEPLAFWKPRLHRFGENREPWSSVVFAPALGWDVRTVFEFLDAIEGCDIVVVDTLRNTCGFQESEGDRDVSRVVLPLIARTRERGQTLVGLYHARKMPGEDGRDISGHHSLYGAFDRALQLRRVPGEDNDRKRRIQVSGRLIGPESPYGMTYEMGPQGRFRSLDTLTFIDEDRAPGAG